MNIAVIPARGGSTRIPGKNIKLFSGKPMIAWAIDAAKAANVFDRIIVSTDSELIADTAKRFGAEVPFVRPEILSDNHTPTAPVLLHALGELSSDSGICEHLCCIYPTVPFIEARYIAEGLELLRLHNAPSVVSVTTYEFPVLRSLTMMDDGSIAFAWPEYASTRSQDLPEFFHDAGQFYWLNVARFLEEKQLFTHGTLPLKLPRTIVQDLDTQEDWDVAERMAQSRLIKAGC